MIQARGTGPQKRLSSELPRLSPPIKKYEEPGGTLIGFRVQFGPEQPLANGSSAGLPLRITWPLTTPIRVAG